MSNTQNVEYYKMLNTQNFMSVPIKPHGYAVLCGYITAWDIKPQCNNMRFNFELFVVHVVYAVWSLCGLCGSVLFQNHIKLKYSFMGFYVVHAVYALFLFQLTCNDLHILLDFFSPGFCWTKHQLNNWWIPAWPTSYSFW